MGPNTGIRRAITRLGIGLLCLAAAGGAHAAQWRYYTVGQGLPNDDVRALLRGADGSVWAATPAGAARYAAGSWSAIAGAEFDVHALASDGLGRIWVGGRDGSSGLLRLFTPGGSPVSPPPAGWQERIDGKITALAPQGAEEMWILTDTAVRKWRRGAVVFSPEILPFDPQRVYFSVTIDAAGLPWIGSDSGLWRFENDVAIDAGPIVPGGSVRQNSVVAIVALTGGGLLVGTLEGEMWRDGANGREPIALPSNTSSSSILACHLDRSGDLWIAREDVFQLRNVLTQPDPNLWPLQRFDAGSGLAGQPIHAFADLRDVDAAEMWFGGEGGISVLRAQNWQLVDTDSGLLGDRADRCAFLSSCNHMTRIASNPNTGELWAGAVEGLSRLRGNDDWTGWVTALVAGPPDPILNNHTRSIHCDDDGTVWVASGIEQFPGGPRSGGLQILPPGGDRDAWITLGLASADARWLINDLVRDEGGALWLAAHDALWRLQVDGADTTRTRFTPLDGAPPSPIISVASEGDFVVAAAARGELAVYSRGAATWTSWSLADRVPNGATVPIRRVALHGGVVYVASAAGLIASNATATDLNAATLLDGSAGYANDLRDLAFDDDGYLLVASNIGLLRTESDLSRWRRLAEADGLASSDLSAVATRGDELWLGSNGKGLMRHVFVAPVTKFERLPEPVVGARDLLSASVSAIDPDSPVLGTQFQWRVDDGAWSVASSSAEIAFIPSDQELAHGEHSLQVRGIDAEFNVEQLPAQASFELDLIPPVAIVTSPRQGDAIAGVVEIRGTVDDIRFDAYRVSVRPSGAATESAIDLVPWTTHAIDAAPIADWDTADGSFPDGNYLLEVWVRDQIEAIGTAQIEVLVDNEFPFAGQSSPLLLRALDGGTLFEVGGRASVVVPPFALARDQVVRLDAVPENSAASGLAFDLSAEQSKFDKSAVLRLEGVASPGSALAVYRQEAGSWMRLGGSESSAGTWDVAIERPGRYALRNDGAESTAGKGIFGLSAEPRLFHAKGGSVDQMAIAFTLGRAMTVHAMIYSRSGRPRRVLAESLALGAGRQVLYWDGRDHAGEMVAPALYIVCVEADGERITQVVSVGRER